MPRQTRINMKKIGNSSLLMAVLEDLHPSQLPGEKTAYQLLEEASAAGIKMCKRSMDRRLEELVRAGKIKTRKGVVNGKSCNLYSEA